MINKMKVYLQKLKSLKIKRVLFFIILPIVILGSILTFLLTNLFKTQASLKQSQQQNVSLSQSIAEVKKEYEDLKNTDQIKRNDELETTLKEIEKTYKDTISAYEALIELPGTIKEIQNYQKQFASILSHLSKRNYSSGAAELKSLKKALDEEKTKLVTANEGIDIAALTNSTIPPNSGYQRQVVAALDTNFIVDIVAADLASTRVIVDTASDSDCRDNCPTLPLATYISRNGAYAGINGSYFCPAEYPSCAGKTNSFDTLAMGKNKHYHNSDNNVYSTVPLVVFGNGWIRFVGASSGWGRDTAVDGVLANQPLLLSGGNVVFGGDGDPKKGSKGNRSFVANKGNTVYIGVVRNATVAETAQVLKAMGMEGALNLDSGGSTALFANGGYKAGPGRNIPNAILFLRK